MAHSDSEDDIYSGGAQLAGSDGESSSGDKPIFEAIDQSSLLLPETQNTLSVYPKEELIESNNDSFQETVTITAEPTGDCTKAEFLASADKHKRQKRILTKKKTLPQLKAKLTRQQKTGFARITVPHDLAQLVLIVTKKSATRYCSVKKFRRERSTTEIIPLHPAKTLRSLDVKTAHLIHSTFGKLSNIVFLFCITLFSIIHLFAPTNR